MRERRRAAAAASRAEVQQRLRAVRAGPGVVPVPDAEPGDAQRPLRLAAQPGWHRRFDAPAVRASRSSCAALRFDGPVHVIAGGRSDYVSRDACGFPPDVPLRRARGHRGRRPLGACRPARRVRCPQCDAAASMRQACRCGIHCIDADGDTTCHDRHPARRRPRIPPLPDAGQDLGHADQGDGHAARPGAGLLARRGRCLHGDRRRPARGRRT